MKHRNHRSSSGTSFNHEKHRAKLWKQEHSAGGFRCSHCKQFVVINDIMGTVNRNHCNICLWSKHVDIVKGDRKADCKAGMRPIALTYKHEGYGKIGELMLVHCCTVCEKISINRLARDDFEPAVLAVFEDSLALGQDLRSTCQQANIYLLTNSDRQQLRVQLFGSD